MVLGLALRQAEGFLRSLAQQLELDIPIPDHTTLSRRARKLGKIPIAAVGCAGPTSSPDNTALTVHTGNQRKAPDQRPWRKLHIAVDAGSGQITAVELTASRAHDSTLVPKLRVLPAAVRALPPGVVDVLRRPRHVKRACRKHTQGGVDCRRSEPLIRFGALAQAREAVGQRNPDKPAVPGDLRVQPPQWQLAQRRHLHRRLRVFRRLPQAAAAVGAMQGRRVYQITASASGCRRAPPTLSTA
jgi:hypothetical protein